MSESRELVERLRRSALPSEYRKRNPDLSDAAMAVGHTYHGLMLTEAADLIERQAKIIEDMERFLSRSFPTCVADSGNYYVKVSYLTLEEAQSSYATLGNIARALTKQ